MHTLQYIAVQSDSKEGAQSWVSSLLESQQGAWFDWFVPGGGRFNRDAIDPYTTDRNYSMAISGKDEPERFEEILQKAAKIRTSTYNELFASCEDEINDLPHLICNYDPAEPKTVISWRLGDLIKMIEGYWTPESFLYYIEEDTTNINVIRANRENLFLVAVDFHF